MRFRLVLLGAVATIAATIPAQSEHSKGWYVGIEGGANWVQDWQYKVLQSPSTTIEITFDSDTGWAGFATVGYGFENHWRFEFEAGYRSNKFTDVHVDIFDAGALAASADQNTYDLDLNEWTMMANALYDIDFGEKVSLSVGAGVGIDRTDLVVGPPRDDEWNFALQGVAGLNYSIGSGAALYLNYRYLEVTGVDIPEATAPGALIEHEDLRNHSVTFGLRYEL